MIAIGSSTAGSIDTARSGIDMLCDRCGASNPAGSKECRNCAERLSTDRVETAAFSIAPRHRHPRWHSSHLCVDARCLRVDCPFRRAPRPAGRLRPLHAGRSSDCLPVDHVARRSLRSFRSTADRAQRGRHLLPTLGMSTQIGHDEQAG
jgi:hypothetical protein